MACGNHQPAADDGASPTHQAGAVPGTAGPARVAADGNAGRIRSAGRPGLAACAVPSAERVRRRVSRPGEGAGTAAGNARCRAAEGGAGRRRVADRDVSLLLRPDRTADCPLTLGALGWTR